MPTPLIVNVPSAELRAEVEKVLAPYPEVQVQETPPTYGLAEISLIVSMVGTSMTALTTLVRFLLDLKDRYAKTGQESGITVGQLGQSTVPLETIDEKMLRRLTGLDDTLKGGKG